MGPVAFLTASIIIKALVIECVRGHALLLKVPLIIPVGVMASLITLDQTVPQLGPCSDVPVVANVSIGLGIAITETSKTISTPKGTPLNYVSKREPCSVRSLLGIVCISSLPDND